MGRKKKKEKRLREILHVLRENEIARGVGPEKFRKIMEELGPTFIKFGQILSMRPDLLPKEYCKELEKLRTDVDPMPFETVKGLIEDECGKKFDEVFAEVQEKPLGSASIAQVHRATLRDGREVVVKIQRPHIRETMERDINLLKKALAALKVVNPLGDAVDFRMVLDEMWASAQEELDFMQEAANLKKFEELNRDIVYVTCPDVLFDLTTERMLVMEYIDGIEVDDTEKLKENGYDIREIGDKLAESYVKQILDDGFFQADPHPGNLVIRGGQIVWIDLGMMGKLTEHDKQLFISAVESIVYHDIFELKDAVLSICEVHGKLDHTALYNDLDFLLSKYAKMDFQTLNVADFIQDMQEVLNKHHISIGHGLTMLIRGIVTMEGVLRDISPKTDFMTIFSNYVRNQAMPHKSFAKELQHIGVDTSHLLKRMADLPGNLIDLIKMVVKGQSKFNIELSESGEFFSHLDMMINRLVIALVDAALLIASSMICMTDMKGKLFGIPALGAIGYILAIVLGLWLVGNIIRSWKER